MDKPPVIRSKSNALLKRAGAVIAGKDTQTLVLEGDRLIDDAIAAGLAIEVILIAESREGRAVELEVAGQSVRRVEDEHLRRVSSLESSPGSLALASRPVPATVALDARTTPRVLVVTGLQDPGHLGALARSAEAAGFSAFITTRGGARPFGPKALRGSMGSLLRLKVYEFEDPSAVAQHLASEGFRQVRAVTRGGASWRSFDWSVPIALWVSGETGEGVMQMAEFEGVSIPMAGEVESLNVTVATSLLLFAAGGAQ